MRRTNGLIVGACTALALAVTAGASAYAFTTERTPAADPRPFASSGAETGTPDPVIPSARTAPRPGAATPSPAGRPSAAPPAVGRHKVGALESVTRLLGYVGGARTETFRYPGASYVKLHFNRLMLLPGDYVTVSDPKGEEVHRYDAAPLLGQAAVDKWAMSVTGDTAILELHRGGGLLSGLTTPLDRLGVGVDQVARGFPRGESAKPATPGREESVCGRYESVDAVCYRSSDPVAYTKSKATARLLINGTELCTGWRIGTNNRMMTNNHCFGTSADAYETEVWFNYACAKCGGYDVLRPTKVWGDRVLATNRTYDYTLFTVENFERVKPFGFLLLDGRRPSVREQLYVPQNPAGEPTKIAGTLGERADNCAVVDNAYDGYARDTDVSYYCDTEGGSSGSPVLSRVSDRVVALHHFGGCPNSGVRADLLYAKIKKLL